MSYLTIVNPENGKDELINSSSGYNILHNYLESLQTAQTGGGKTRAELAAMKLKAERARAIQAGLVDQWSVAAKAEVVHQQAYNDQEKLDVARQGDSWQAHQNLLDRLSRRSTHEARRRAAPVVGAPTALTHPCHATINPVSGELEEDPPGCMSGGLPNPAPLKAAPVVHPKKRRRGLFDWLRPKKSTAAVPQTLQTPKPQWCDIYAPELYDKGASGNAAIARDYNKYVTECDKWRELHGIEKIYH